jgi:hypothetical protein
MSLISIFGLFGFNEDDNPENKKIESELKEYKETPHFKLGMFQKLIINGGLFSKRIIKFFSQADPSFDEEGIDEAGEYMMYTRAWFWIEQCRIRKKDWKEALKQYSTEEFLVAVKLSIKYFEDIEEYEKCAFLKKIQDFIEKNLPK